MKKAWVLLFLLLTACTPKEDTDSPAPTEVSTDIITEMNADIVTEMEEEIAESPAPAEVGDYVFQIEDVPEYTGYASVEIHQNIPFFTETERNEWIAGTEYYSHLDDLGRCGVTFACIGEETMPAYGEERGEIGMVKPAGWHTVKYPEVISDLYLYNRCHLIGWQLGAENANERNLTTGTRYLNVEGMLPYEDEVADYVHDTKHHVLYRVTPYFVGDELVCRGILMEAESVEDDTIRFCVWCYNVQPGITIDYVSGESWLIAEENAPEEAEVNEDVRLFVVNKNSGKVHLPECEAVSSMKEKNRMECNGTVKDMIRAGYEPCKICNPW